MNQDHDQNRKNLAVELAKHKAKQAAKRQAKALLKKGAKVVARLAVNVVMGTLKALFAWLIGLSLPVILVIIGCLILMIFIFLGFTFIYSGTETDIGIEAQEIRAYIIEQSNNTVDLSRPEQIPYKVPSELIIAALQIYEGGNPTEKESKEAIKTMAEALTPIFTYEEFEGSIETEVTKCVTSQGSTSCNTNMTKTPTFLTYLTGVIAWDVVRTTTVSEYTTEWSVNVSENSEWRTEYSYDNNGNIIPGQTNSYEVKTQTTTRSRAHTHLFDSVDTEDYTYFDRVLSDPPFDYKREDKLLVEALYELTGNYIGYTNWLNGNSMIGFDGIVVPGEGVPQEFMQYYLEAEKKYKVDWYYLAAIHFIETGFSTHPTMISSVGAEGHMQFMPCTWVGWRYPGCSGTNGYVYIPDNIKYNPLVIQQYGGLGIDANGNGIASTWEPKDAIFAAANLLNRNGFSQNIDKAIRSYNHSDYYVKQVKENALRFKQESSYFVGDSPKNPNGFIRPTEGRVSSSYGWRNLGGKNDFHNGIDLASGKTDTPVLAAADGVITRAVTGCPPIGSLQSRCGGGFGNHVYMEHVVGGVKYVAVYAHLRTLAGLREGQKVQQGQFLGIQGTSGQSTGIHLHFELHKGTRNGRVNSLNPALYIPL